MQQGFDINAGFKCFPGFFNIQSINAVIPMQRDKTGSHAVYIPDDSGQLSIDFIVGLAIFMIALIMIATMASGLLVGLSSKTIDYDAVAYRTGVILVEDPGEPNYRPQAPIEDRSMQWEFIGKSNKDKVLRFGLSLYKSTPKILAQKKVESYGNKGIYDSLEDYRNRIIFGDYPYHFNISLVPIEGLISPVSAGEPFNPYSSYGYIRRVVLIKTPGEYAVDLYDNYQGYGDGEFSVLIDSAYLLNREKGPIYWTDLMKEELKINLTNVSGIANGTLVNLTQITYSYYYFDIYADKWKFTDPSKIEPPSKTIGFNMTADGNQSNYTLNNIHSYISTDFTAGYFIDKTSVSGNRVLIAINYTFDRATANISSTPTVRYMNVPPRLIPAVLEVRVW